MAFGLYSGLSFNAPLEDAITFLHKNRPADQSPYRSFVNMSKLDDSHFKGLYWFRL